MLLPGELKQRYTGESLFCQILITSKIYYILMRIFGVVNLGNESMNSHFSSWKTRCRKRCLKIVKQKHIHTSVSYCFLVRTRNIIIFTRIVHWKNCLAVNLTAIIIIHSVKYVTKIIINIVKNTVLLYSCRVIIVLTVKLCQTNNKI